MLCYITGRGHAGHPGSLPPAAQRGERPARHRATLIMLV